VLFSTAISLKKSVVPRVKAEAAMDMPTGRLGGEVAGTRAGELQSATAFVAFELYDAIFLRA
jgi:hypothetical protein